ncbi:hypothetical protein [Phormidesmis priestleyi]|nr:hypothetical protein [Phormidesmis priestleyi]
MSKPLQVRLYQTIRSRQFLDLSRELIERRILSAIAPKYCKSLAYSQ